MAADWSGGGTALLRAHESMIAAVHHSTHCAAMLRAGCCHDASSQGILWANAWGGITRYAAHHDRTSDQHNDPKSVPLLPAMPNVYASPLRTFVASAAAAVAQNVLKAWTAADLMHLCNATSCFDHWKCDWAFCNIATSSSVSPLAHVQ